MRQRNNMVLIVPVLILLSSVSNSYSWKENSSTQNLVTGIFAVGVAVAGAVGAFALADWYFSETDDQLITRVDSECRNIVATYAETMKHFLNVSGMDGYLLADYKPYTIISEAVLYDFGTYVWNSKISQSSYRANVIGAKAQLQSAIQKLRNRIHALENKNRNYADQQRLRTMRKLLNSVEELYVEVALFADCLEHHKTYFDLYDRVGVIRNGYVQYFAVTESGAYVDVIAYNLKNAIIYSIGGRYPFRTFINAIDSDISLLRSNIRALEYDYPAGRRYANLTLDGLVWMKNAVVIDPRYAQELYDWEQARLQMLQIEALEAQARAERDRVNAMRDQNRILNEHNRLEQEKLWLGRNSGYNTVPDVNVRVDIIL